MIGIDGVGYGREFVRSSSDVESQSRIAKAEEISIIECSLNSDLIAVRNWLKTNKLSCNTSRTSYMTIGSRQNLANAKFMNLELDNRPIEHKPSTKLLGIHIDEMLT